MFFLITSTKEYWWKTLDQVPNACFRCVRHSDVLAIVGFHLYNQNLDIGKCGNCSSCWCIDWWWYWCCVILGVCSIYAHACSLRKYVVIQGLIFALLHLFLTKPLARLSETLSGASLLIWIYFKVFFASAAQLNQHWDWLFIFLQDALLT